MTRLRDAIFGIFEDVVSQYNGSMVMVSTRPTRVNGSHPSIDVIPPTGGLRISLSNRLILVETDRSGGIAHLMHCWIFLANHSKEERPHISLFYVFLTPSRAASEHYRALWDFMILKARDDCGDCLQVHFAACERLVHNDPHASISGTIINHYASQLRAQGILEAFEWCLAGETPVGKSTPTFHVPRVMSRANIGENSNVQLLKGGP